MRVERGGIGPLRARLVVIAGHEPMALAAWGRRIALYGVCVEHFVLRPTVGVFRAGGLSVTPGHRQPRRPEVAAAAGGAGRRDERRFTS